MNHRDARITLNMLPGIGPGRKQSLVTYFGSPEAALSASIEELCKLPGIGSKLAPIIHNWQRYCDPTAEQRMAYQAGVRIITEEDDDYPPLLKEIHDPPICLYLRGSLQYMKQTEISVGIVGARGATGYGIRMASNLARDASYAGAVVVSGLARGIDTAAHTATLNAGGKTVAVIGSGLYNIYPPENIGLANAIVNYGGAVISEFPMMFRADRHTFPMRNRIISGMTRGVIVVEAGIKSGSLITAAQALEQNRTVFAVPGQADSAFSKGCHALLRDGAVLTETFADVINEFTGLPGMKPPPEERQSVPLATPTPTGLSDLEQKLWALIQAGHTDVDEIIDNSDEEPTCVSAAILTLELKRLIRQLPGRKIKLLV